MRPPEQDIDRRDPAGAWSWFRGPDHGLPAAGWGHASPGGIHAHPADSSRAWATIGGRLYATADAGDSWQVIHEGPDLQHIAADPTRPDGFYLSGERGLYATDDGRAFRFVGGPRSDGRLAVGARGRVLQAVTGGPRPGVWRHDPSTAAWTRLWDEPWAHGIAVDPTDPDRIAVSTNQNPYTEDSAATGIWFSADGGTSWFQANRGLAVHRGWCIAFDPHDGEALVFGAFGRGFWRADWPRDHVPTGDRRYAHRPIDAAFADPLASILSNGSMSEGEDRVAHWDGTWEDGRSVRDTDIGIDGPSLRVWAENEGTGIAFQQVEERAGETFHLSGHLRSVGPAAVDVAVMAFTGDWQRNEYLQITHQAEATDWRPFDGTVSIPDWAARFVVLLRIEGAGSAWLDEMAMPPAVD